MDLPKFDRLVAEARTEHPVWFGLPSDRPATWEDIARAEETIGTRLPYEYRAFLNRYGGGYFAFTIIYSLDGSSSWNLLEMNETWTALRGGYLLVSENGAGDFFGFRIVSGECESCVSFWDHEIGEWRATDYDDILEFIADTGLKA